MNYRNGDWGFYPISEGEATASLSEKKNHDGSFVFAEAMSWAEWNLITPKEWLARVPLIHEN